MSEPQLAWELLKEEILPTLGRRRRVLRRTFRLPDGRVEDFDIKLEPHIVTIFALTEEKNVVLAKQFRPGPARVLMELPGGGVEEGETPLEAAARELLEETGYAGELRQVAESTNCAYTTLVRHHFIATGCHKVQEQHTDSTEFIQAVEVALAELHTLIQNGSLTDAETAYRALEAIGL